MQEMYERKNDKVMIKARVDKISSRSQLPWLRRPLNQALTPPRDGGFVKDLEKSSLKRHKREALDCGLRGVTRFVGKREATLNL